MQKTLTFKKTLKQLQNIHAAKAALDEKLVNFVTDVLTAENNVELMLEMHIAMQNGKRFDDYEDDCDFFAEFISCGDDVFKEELHDAIYFAFEE